MVNLLRTKKKLPLALSAWELARNQNIQGNLENIYLAKSKDFTTVKSVGWKHIKRDLYGLNDTWKILKNGQRFDTSLGQNISQADVQEDTRKKRYFALGLLSIEWMHDFDLHE